jgi:hypothetical protein
LLGTKGYVVVVVVVQGRTSKGHVCTHGDQITFEKKIGITFVIISDPNIDIQIA